MCINSTYSYGPDSWKASFSLDSSARYVSSAVAVASVIGSLVVLGTSLCISQLRKATSRQILACIALADTLSSLANAAGSLFYLGFPGCRVQALITVLASLAFVLWTTCLAVYLYLSLVLDRVKLAKRLRPAYHLVSWGIPIAVGTISYLLGALGTSESQATVGWCWVDQEPETPSSWSCRGARLLWMLVTMKGWELLSYVIVIALYVHMKYILSKQLSPDSEDLLSINLRQSLQGLDRKLLIVPLTYVLLRAPGTVRAFLDFTSSPKVFDKTFYDVLLYLQAIGDNAQGLSSFILFVCFSKLVRTELLRVCACHQCTLSWHQQPDEVKHMHGHYARVSKSNYRSFGQKQVEFEAQEMSESGSLPIQRPDVDAIATTPASDELVKQQQGHRNMRRHLPWASNSSDSDNLREPLLRETLVPGARFDLDTADYQRDQYGVMSYPSRESSIN